MARVSVKAGPGVPMVRAATSLPVAVGIGRDGQVYQWGTVGPGSLWGAATQVTTTPQLATPAGFVWPSRPVEIAVAGPIATQATVLVLLEDGSLYAFGYGGQGLLGQGTTENSATPIKVKLPAGTVVREIAMNSGSHSATDGDASAMVLTSTGDVYAWGANRYGQLGIGTKTTALTPVRMSFPGGAKIAGIARGGTTGYAFSDAGTLYAWGLGVEGRLATGNTADSTTPVQAQRGQMPAGARVVAVAAGTNSGYLLASDGAVYGWGRAAHGRLGTGSLTDPSVPTRAAMPAGVTFTSLVAGPTFAFGATASGQVYAWGWNTAGNLCLPPADSVLVPTPIPQPAGVTYAAAGATGGYSSVLLSTDEDAYFCGQLPYPTGPSVSVLTQVVRPWA
ncbi:hypothetical protein [Cellulomonas sp. HD19AZ1]|uniref:RCC1 domain-containing protein n=1 Tax=Cellulomonas sp. HD19AZ1 TaxID=2559593 RepID=UPI001430B9D3|nr:hypothetical protein [Cellulomonas sp. HD19AZ1]